MEPHVFQGRLDRWCELCNLPDRHPIHVVQNAVRVRLCLWTMWDTGERRLANEVVESLGIRYSSWQSHPIADQIHLIGVDPASLPSPLPKFLEVF